ncbi:MAG: PH domain-containing protein [Deltaproteobacteria bacterium]|nr:PH domain-containing protein [Deltaproteobacteria bacterium]
MKFKSAVGWWYYLLLVGVSVLLVVSLFPLMRSGQLSLVAVLGIFLFSLGLPVWLLFSTHYQVSGEMLQIKSGPFSWSVPLAEIRSMAPSRSAFSAPALSLDRIEIVYGEGKRILISPAKKEEFLRAVEKVTELSTRK